MSIPIVQEPLSKAEKVNNMILNSACNFPALPKVVLVTNTSQKNFQNILGKTQAHFLPKIVERCTQEGITT